ncbi:MAG: pantetheine-phosphate adenylyltransferase [Acidimicrobiaceae bacterium]|nr:pantetheine-phosphate adenylyltransferase [Acidimicrobiaceae bacterium]
MTTALFPGSFDPFHNGHLEVVERARSLFEGFVVAVVRNPSKREALFDVEDRLELIEACVGGGVSLVTTDTLTVEVAREVGADVIVRGVRAVSDFENELQMAQMNRQLSGIETLFVPTGTSYSFIASRLIREVARYGGDVSAFVPEPVARKMKERFGG